jgi:aminoglycoside phosphotransferase
VIEYQVRFINKKREIENILIYCSAHSSEPRKTVYDVLKFLWLKNFPDSYFTLPQPLYYSNSFRAVFYQGVDGENLYHFLKIKDEVEIKKIVILTGALFAKLHTCDIKNAKNFNRINSRIKTVFPGMKNALEKIKQLYPQYYDGYLKIYKKLVKAENSFLNKTEQRWLVHGDAHPENIIRTNSDQIALIDFADTCLSDFARDLGSFLQQLEFMGHKKIDDDNFIDNLKDLFLASYQENAKINIDAGLRRRIDIYYNFTALRTANYFLIKHDPEPERAKGLIEHISNNL